MSTETGQTQFALKDNRPSQRAEVDAWFADPLNRPAGEHTTTDADHGRLEVRRHRVSHDVDWLLSDRRHPDEARMPGLAMIGEVEATTTRDGRTTTVRRFYLSSARLDAPAFARAVRAHWAIENSLHWVLDVGFDEDRARTRRDHAPENVTGADSRARLAGQAGTAAWRTRSGSGGTGMAPGTRRRSPR